MNKKVCFILAAVAAVTGAMADEVDRSNVNIRVGMGPSHIVGSPDPIFTEGLKNFADDPEYKEVLEKLRARCDELTAEYTRPEIVVFKEAENAKAKSGKK